MAKQIVTAGKSGIKTVDGKAVGEFKPPSLVTQAKSFARAAYEHNKAGRPQADEETLAKRIALCEACEHFGREGIWKNRCKLCGCFMKVKARWADRHCKINKW